MESVSKNAGTARVGMEDGLRTAVLKWPMASKLHAALRCVWIRGLKSVEMLELLTEVAMLERDQLIDDDQGASFPDSKIAHGGLLARVIYPPQYTSGGGQPATDRDVWFAYNAQGQEVWRQDQTELEIQQD